MIQKAQSDAIMKLRETAKIERFDVKPEDKQGAPKADAKPGEKADAPKK